MKRKTVINIGKNWVAAAENRPKLKELSVIYKSSLPIIAKLFQQYVRAKKLRTVAVADFGGANGEITQYLNNHVQKGVKLHTTCFDSAKELLGQNTSAQKRVHIDLQNIAVKEKFDVGIMRYVLNYNSFSVQRKIVQNMYRALKPGGILIHLWCGVPTILHQRRFQKLFASKAMNKKFYRPRSYWSTWQENKVLFSDAGFKLTVVSRYHYPVQEQYKIRYDLSTKENKEVQGYLGRYAFISFVVFVAEKV